MRVFVPGAYAWMNKGDVALVRGVEAWLNQHAFGAERTYTFFAAGEETRVGVSAVPMFVRPDGRFAQAIHAFAHRSRVPWLAALPVGVQVSAALGSLRLVLRLRRLLGPRAETLLTRGQRSFIRAVEAADSHLAMPGGYLIARRTQDDWWLYHYANLRAIALCGGRATYAPCSVGPFTRSYGRAAARLFREAEVICVREELSAAELSRLGVPADRVRVIPDLAFLLRGPIRASDGADSSPPVIGISVRDHTFPGTNRVQRRQRMARYERGVADVALRMIDRKGVTIRLISQTLSDVAVTWRVAERIGRPESVEVLAEDYDVEELLEIYGRVDLMIGTRMHANIMAMVAGTPVVGIAYEPKTQGIMDLLGFGDRVVPIEVADRDLGPVVERAFEERTELARATVEGVSRMRRQIDAAGVAVFQGLRLARAAGEHGLAPEVDHISGV